MLLNKPLCHYAAGAGVNQCQCACIIDVPRRSRFQSPWPSLENGTVLTSLKGQRQTDRQTRRHMNDTVLFMACRKHYHNQGYYSSVISRVKNTLPLQRHGKADNHKAIDVEAACGSVVAPTDWAPI